MSYWESRIAEKQYVSYTHYLIKHYFLLFTVAKFISIKAHFMVRNKHDKFFLSYKKLHQKKTSYLMMKFPSQYTQQ